MTMYDATAPSRHQDAGVEQAGGVEARLRGRQRRAEQLRALLEVPGHVVAADGVVMGDGAAGVDHGVGGGALDVPPLFRQAAVVADGVPGEIGRRPVRIDVGEAAGHDAGPAGDAGDRVLGRALAAVVEIAEPGPR